MHINTHVEINDLAEQMKFLRHKIKIVLWGKTEVLYILEKLKQAKYSFVLFCNSVIKCLKTLKLRVTNL